MSRILITGGTGFIGRALVQRLLAGGHDLIVITRQPDRYQNTEKLRYIGRFGDIANDTIIDAVINLGGEGIGDRRWSEKRKQVLHDSRIRLTDHLVECLARLDHKPAVMISGSAIGWYGARDDQALNEQSDFHDEFSHALCRDWEAAAAGVTDLGVRLCTIRLGVVLGPGGGALKRMLPPFYFGLGGPMGSGQQMMSWVHLDDVLEVLVFLVNREDTVGIYNLTAPEAVSNREFARTLGQVLGRPAILPVPGFVLKLLFGEMADRLLLHGQNVMPARLLESGYTFNYPSLYDALANILER